MICCVPLGIFAVALLALASHVYTSDTGQVCSTLGLGIPHGHVEEQGASSKELYLQFNLLLVNNTFFDDRGPDWTKTCIESMEEIAIRPIGESPSAPGAPLGL